MGPACCTACVLSSWSSLDDMQADEAAHKIISAVAVVERFTFIQAPSLRNRDGIAVLATGAATVAIAAIEQGASQAGESARS
jgi:hypothetical protein